MIAATFPRLTQTASASLSVLNKTVWMSSLRRSGQARLEINPKRYAMNPNRLASDLLSRFEGAFFKAQLKLEVRQSTSGVLHVGKECAESLLNVLFSRISSIAHPGSTLQLHWSRQREGLSLRLSLNPAPQKHPLRAPLPLLPMGSPLRNQLNDAGIRYQSEGGNGPWTLGFDCIDI